MTMRYRKPRLLIVGCGDIGLRVAALLQHRWQLTALTSSPERMPLLRAAGVRPLEGDLDQPDTLKRLHRFAFDAVLHLAPPPSHGGLHDPRTKHLLQALHPGIQRLIYASTTGVYGDAQGELLHEHHRVNPLTPRAQRRIDAENQVRHFGRTLEVRVTVLRIPGIYALDRPSGDPRTRVIAQTPVLMRQEDVYTNHIHADDLARALVAALHRGRAQQVVNVCDDTQLKMGDYFDLVAKLCHLSPPPRISRAQAADQLSPMQLSFMRESRRLSNARLKTALRLKLRYPTVAEGLVQHTRQSLAEPKH